jgi:hypothetical protein
MSEIVDRLRELSANEDPGAFIQVTRDEADDVLALIDQLSNGTLGD